MNRDPHRYQIVRGAAVQPANVLSYRSGDRCRGCGRANWFIRSATAECAFCAFAVPLGEAA